MEKDKIIRLELERGHYLKINLNTRMVHRYNKKGNIVESTVLTPHQFEVMQDKLLELTEE